VAVGVYSGCRSSGRTTTKADAEELQIRHATPQGVADLPGCQTDPIEWTSRQLTDRSKPVACP
jgi:hypothetical protein